MRPSSKASTPLLYVLLTLLVLWLPNQAAAQNINLIRDEEIENTIRAYATPLFQAAGLSPSGIRIFLVEDKSLNAFVAGGQNLFINTGLLMAAKDPLEVIGVIAHETGHISGGHLASRGDALEQAQTSVLATYALGLAAAVASGRPDLGFAVLSAGQDVALKGLLRYTRSQESAADQAAMTFLKATKQSPSGLRDFTKKLSGKEVLLSNNQDPYLRTHPLTTERIDFFESETERSPYKDDPARPEFIAMHQRMLAKLTGFLSPTGRALREYPESDKSLPARYARAIAYYRIPNLERAVPLIDELLLEHPDDPYFHELKGQMLFENGRLDEARLSYRRAVELLPRSAGFRLSLARVQIELNRPAMDQAALENLKLLFQRERSNGFAWRLAATAYGRQKNQAMTSLALAEAALASGEYVKAEALAARAEQLLPTGSPAALRAQDLQSVALRNVKKNKGTKN